LFEGEFTDRYKMKTRMIICPSWAIRAQAGAISWYVTKRLK